MLTAYRIKADGSVEEVEASKDLPLWSELPEGETYICKHCKREVILRKNFYKQHRVPHFAHKEGGVCGTWEPESEEHLYLKRLVADVFSLIAQKVEIEKRDGIFSGEYYPDIYVELNNMKIAVEIQCSNKNTKDILEKTKWYSEHGVYTLWLWRFPEEKKLVRWKTSVQERLMVELYGGIPFIDVDGNIHLVFKELKYSKTIWGMRELSEKFSDEILRNWFVPTEKKGLLLYSPECKLSQVPEPTKRRVVKQIPLVQEYDSLSKMFFTTTLCESVMEDVKNAPPSQRAEVWVGLVEKILVEVLENKRYLSRRDVRCLLYNMRPVYWNAQRRARFWERLVGYGGKFAFLLEKYKKEAIDLENRLGNIVGILKEME